MKTRSSILLLLTMLVALGLASCTTTLDAGKPSNIACFMRTYGGTFDEAATAVSQTSDGGYVALGTTSTYGHGSQDFYLARFDPTGLEVWEQEYGTNAIETATALLTTHPTTTGVADGYLMYGTTTGYGYFAQGVYLVKADLNGNQLWEKHFKSDTTANRSNQSSAMLALANGGYLLAGWSWVKDTSYRTPCLMAIDDTGRILWSRLYPDTTGTLDRKINGIVQTPDGGFVAVGSQLVRATGQISIYFLQVDATGKKIKDATLPTTPGEGFGIDLDPGGYVVYGYTVSSGASTIYVSNDYKFSAAPATTATNSGFASQFNSGCRTRDGGTIAIGTTTANGSNDIVIMKEDASVSSVPQWVHTFGGPRIDQGISVKQTNDGGYILLGTTQSFGPHIRTGHDLILIKVDQDGNLCN